MTEKRNKMLAVRASDEEVARFKSLVARLKKSNRYVRDSDVLRELIGFEDTGLITEAMRRELRPETPNAAGTDPVRLHAPPELDVTSPELIDLDLDQLQQLKNR